VRGRTAFGTALDSSSEDELRANLLEDIVGFLNVIEGTLMHLSLDLSDPKTGCRDFIYSQILKPGEEWKFQGRVVKYLQDLLLCSVEDVKTNESTAKTHQMDSGTTPTIHRIGVDGATSMLQAVI
jgi:hypothetical protein